MRASQNNQRSGGSKNIQRLSYSALAAKAISNHSIFNEEKKGKLVDGDELNAGDWECKVRKTFISRFRAELGAYDLVRTDPENGLLPYEGNIADEEADVENVTPTLINNVPEFIHARKEEEKARLNRACAKVIAQYDRELARHERCTPVNRRNRQGARIYTWDPEEVEDELNYYNSKKEDAIAERDSAIEELDEPGNNFDKQCAKTVVDLNKVRLEEVKRHETALANAIKVFNINLTKLLLQEIEGYINNNQVRRAFHYIDKKFTRTVAATAGERKDALLAVHNYRYTGEHSMTKNINYFQELVYRHDMINHVPLTPEETAELFLKAVKEGDGHEQLKGCAGSLYTSLEAKLGAIAVTWDHCKKVLTEKYDNLVLTKKIDPNKKSNTFKPRTVAATVSEFTNGDLDNIHEVAYAVEKKGGARRVVVKRPMTIKMEPMLKRAKTPRTCFHCDSGDHFARECPHFECPHDNANCTNKRSGRYCDSCRRVVNMHYDELAALNPNGPGRTGMLTNEEVAVGLQLNQSNSSANE